MDQFFDEAQWESYRKLGELTAGGLFAQVDPARPLREAFVQPPPALGKTRPAGRDPGAAGA